jgi:hypothetical protein
MGMQMGIPTPRRLVLIRDRRQTRQAHQVFLAGARVVHPGVAGVRGQVFQRF